MKKRVFYSLVAVSWVLGGLACTHRQEAPSRVLRVQLANDPVSLDPAQAEDGVSMRVLMNTMEGLYRYDSLGKLLPGLFDKMEISDQSRKFRFWIKPGLLWSDGTPLGAEDILRGIQYALSPEVPSKLVELLFPIRGARAYKLKKGSWNQVGIRVHENELTLELEKSSPWFVHVLALPITYPRKNNSPFVPGKTPTNGAYSISSYQRGKQIQLTRNENSQIWRQAHPGSPSEVELWTISDEATAMRLFEQNKLDVLTRISPLERKRATVNGRFEAFPILATYYIGMNVRDPWFQSSLMRRAFSLSIQKLEITQALGGADIPSSSWIPEGLEGYSSYRELPAKQKEEVFAAAKKWISKHPIRSPLLLIYDQSSVNQIVMEKVQQDVKKKLGISIQLQSSDWKTHVKSLSPVKASAFRFGWLSPFMDPIANLRAMTTGSTNNYSGWKSSVFDEWTEKISALPPGEKRLSMIQKAQEFLLNEESVIIPIFHYRLFHAFSNRVDFAQVNPLSVLNFHEVQLKESSQ